jgi:predicted HTH transcriptional regulator
VVINAIIHNDYSTELVPKFEVFANRMEITSAASVHPGQEQQDFFAGYSMPRNKTLMRVFKDLGMVEYLGSGMPRILKVYPREAFGFAAHFIRATFAMSPEALALEKEVAADRGVQSRPESRLESRLESRPESKLALQLESPMAAKLVWLLADGPLGKTALAQALGHASVSGELNKQVARLQAQMLIEMTLPDKPNSRLQKYRLTEQGQVMLTEQQRNP